MHIYIHIFIKGYMSQKIELKYFLPDIAQNKYKYHY